MNYIEMFCSLLGNAGIDYDKIVNETQHLIIIVIRYQNDADVLFYFDSDTYVLKESGFDVDIFQR